MSKQQPHDDHRVLVSARDGGALWDLRCLVREQLLVWLQSQGREYLPLQRVELQPQTTTRSSALG